MAKDTKYFYNNIGVTGVVANGTIGSEGQALLSNGSAAYWGSSALGSQGPQGYQGDVGAQGDTGAQGAQGYQGDTGAQGATGPVAGSNSHVIYNNDGVAGGSANFVFDDVNNRVGIGTGSPNYTLSVSGVAEITGAKETTFTITDGASVNLDPNNGSIQIWTLGGSREPDQANWAAGQSITLMIDDGTDYAITWTTLGVVWETGGGTAPTLATSGFTVIVLWKVGSTIYGARVGDA